MKVFSLQYRAEEEVYSTDDEVYCDCFAAQLYRSLPGTPGKQGVIMILLLYMKFAKKLRQLQEVLPIDYGKIGI